MRRVFVFVMLLAMVVTVVAIASDSTKVAEKKVVDQPVTIKQKAVTDSVETKAEEATKAVTEVRELVWNENKSGLKWTDLKVGEGHEAENGDEVDVHYHIWLAKDGEKGKSIQNSKDSGKPFAFTVGQKNLVKGWNEGTVGMKPGGIRRLLLPPELGWGERGMGTMIPPNASVIFEIELLKFRSKK